MLTLRERQYIAARKATATLTSQQIDDKLNLHGLPHALRDEILERLSRLESLERTRAEAVVE